MITATGEGHLEQTYGVASNHGSTAPVPALSGLARRIADDATRGYVEEAVACLGCGARRAAVVFLWTGAVATLRNTVWESGAVGIEVAWSRHNQRARFRKKGDFEDMKDAHLLEIAEDLDVIDGSQKTILRHALDLRNTCGHPVKYAPGESKVASYIEDVAGIVWP